VTAADRERSRAALTAATRQAAACAGAAGVAEDRHRAVADLLVSLEDALAVWEPLRAAHELTDSLSGLVRGTSADNQLQVRLSSYVLAARLDQVLAAANERLAVMRDQRYTVRRCARDGGPGRNSASRTGLGLELLDAWTGETRPPSTLSGGETFVVSLALALGLADVVSEESGGLRVGTLFVDEGFGMLDPDTLDDVMDRIDALRAGGRTVGVVSHVTELRARIPTQVHVTTGRDGSRLCVRAPDLAPA
jgi:exonuclease SbcC